MSYKQSDIRWYTRTVEGIEVVIPQVITYWVSNTKDDAGVEQEVLTPIMWEHTSFYRNDVDVLRPLIERGDTSLDIGSLMFSEGDVDLPDGPPEWVYDNIEDPASEGLTLEMFGLSRKNTKE